MLPEHRDTTFNKCASCRHVERFHGRPLGEGHGSAGFISDDRDHSHRRAFSCAVGREMMRLEQL